MMLYSVFVLAPAVVFGGLGCVQFRTIRTKSDLAKMQGCVSNVGSLTFDATEPLDVTLNLESQVGEIKIIGDNIMNVQLTKLKSMKGDLFIKASNVETIQFNAMKSQVGNIEISESKKLKQVSFDNLQSVVGDMRFTNLENVESIELPNFKALCGDFELTGADKLTTFSLPNMEAYEVKLSIDLKSLSELNLGKMVEKSGSSINFKNKATFKMNTVIEKDCKGRNNGNSDINPIKNDASSDKTPYSIQFTYLLLLSGVVSTLYSAI